MRRLRGDGDLEVTWDDGQLQPLDPDTFRLLVDWVRRNHPSDAALHERVRNAVYTRKKIIRIGFTYSPVARNSYRNSNVAVKVNGPPVFDVPAVQQNWRPAQITHLFSHTLTDNSQRSLTRTFAVVRPYKELNADDEQHNVYSQYGYSGGKLVYSDMEAPILVSLAEVLGHASVNAIQVVGISAKTVLCMPFTQLLTPSLE